MLAALPIVAIIVRTLAGADVLTSRYVAVAAPLLLVVVGVCGGGGPARGAGRARRRPRRHRRDRVGPHPPPRAATTRTSAPCRRTSPTSAGAGRGAGRERRRRPDRLQLLRPGRRSPPTRPRHPGPLEPGDLARHRGPASTPTGPPASTPRSFSFPRAGEQRTFEAQRRLRRDPPAPLSEHEPRRAAGRRTDRDPIQGRCDVNARIRFAVVVAVVAAGAVAVTTALAGGGGGEIRERLSGYEEVPAVSTPASGDFQAHVRASRNEIPYRLKYSALTGAVEQAHIHFGQEAVSGGISVFLCSNLGNGPAGTQPCPPGPATISGTIRPSDVIGPTTQGIGAERVRRARRRDQGRRHLRQRPQRHVQDRRDPRAAEGPRRRLIPSRKTRGRSLYCPRCPGTSRLTSNGRSASRRLAARGSRSGGRMAARTQHGSAHAAPAQRRRRRGGRRLDAPKAKAKPTSLVTFKGRAGARPNGRVTIQRKAGRRWTTIARGRTAKRGRFALTWTTPSRRTRVAVRAVLAGRVPLQGQALPRPGAEAGRRAGEGVEARAGHQPVDRPVGPAGRAARPSRLCRRQRRPEGPDHRDRARRGDPGRLPRTGHRRRPQGRRRRSSRRRPRRSSRPSPRAPCISSPRR